MEVKFYVFSGYGDLEGIFDSREEAEQLIADTVDSEDYWISADKWGEVEPYTRMEDLYINEDAMMAGYYY